MTGIERDDSMSIDSIIHVDELASIGVGLSLAGVLMFTMKNKEEILEYKRSQNDRRHELTMELLKEIVGPVVEMLMAAKSGGATKLLTSGGK